MRKYLNFVAVLGIVTLCCFTLTLSTGSVLAETDQPECANCHGNIYDPWSHSPHAHAFDDEVFYQRWEDMGGPIECLVCHTTSFDLETGEVYKPGVDCEACHGEASADHPQTSNEILADEYYCGGCHTTTLSEWRLTGHKRAGIGCINCHDPHSQQNLFEDPDDLCINCHENDMGDYLEDLHIQSDIGCVDCHALVIPPDEIPQDGIVPTGHGFTITVGTCIACHTDTLHAGFALPGYENGATDTIIDLDDPEDVTSHEEDEDLTERDQQVLDSANSTKSMLNIFQGGLVGLALGGSTAWIVAINFRKRSNSIIETGKKE